MPPFLEDIDGAFGPLYAPCSITPTSKRAREPSQSFEEPDCYITSTRVFPASFQPFGLRTPETGPRPPKRICDPSVKRTVCSNPIAAASVRTTDPKEIGEWLRHTGIGRPGEGFVVISTSRKHSELPTPTSSSSKTSHALGSDELAACKRSDATDEDENETLDEENMLSINDWASGANSSAAIRAVIGKEVRHDFDIEMPDVTVSESYDKDPAGEGPKGTEAWEGVEFQDIVMSIEGGGREERIQAQDQKGSVAEDRDAMMRTSEEREAFNMMLPFLSQGNREQLIDRNFETVSLDVLCRPGQRDAVNSSSPSPPALDSLFSTTIPELLCGFEVSRGSFLDLSASLIAELRGLEGEPGLILQAVAFLASMLPEGIIDQPSEATRGTPQREPAKVSSKIRSAAPKRKKSYRWVEFRLDRCSCTDLVHIGNDTIKSISEVGIKSLVHGFQLMPPSMLDSYSEGHTSQLLGLITKYNTTTDNSYIIGIKKVAFCIAFFIMSGNSPNQWIHNAAHRAQHCKRMPTVPKEDIEMLWEEVKEGSFGIGQKFVTKDAFTKAYERLRLCGSWYLWLAQQVGAGALLYLHQMFPPDEVHNAPKGKDQSGGSELLCRKLKDEYGMEDIAWRSGATKMMNDLMWETMEEFDGIVRPSRHEEFPGFRNESGK